MLVEQRNSTKHHADVCIAVHNSLNWQAISAHVPQDEIRPSHCDTPDGPNVTEAVIPGAGHWLMEEAPEATIATVRQFLGPANAKKRK